MSYTHDNGAVNEPKDAFFDQEAQKRLAETIQAWMDAKSLKKRPLALAAGISRTTLDAMLNATRPPELEKLARVASVFDVTISALLDGRLPSGGDKPKLPPTDRARLQELEAQVALLRDLPRQVEDLGTQLAGALADLQSFRTLLRSRGIE